MICMNIHYKFDCRSVIYSISPPKLTLTSVDLNLNYSGSLWLPVIIVCMIWGKFQSDITVQSNMSRAGIKISIFLRGLIYRKM